ncbi:putative transposase [Selenomonas ruminantium subsp. lactilytica TAM6421]|uniref:Putative transposase n=1 Tax=Selenomonas ruminantium subsp. lactilytica (strain NBRC 103574 / TAM6421) TaxID=927704 RepID=I0GQT1_SELRL|nr:putative transposase [Selenomonas ruminantium subsp. lactilytica TAM6421]
MSLMNSKDIPRACLEEGSPKTSQEELDDMKQKMHDMQLEMDILKETIAVLKKDPGINLDPLKNREKVVIIDALQQKYSLPVLLLKLGLSRSSYYYQKKVQNRIDKYADLREKIRELFFKSRQCYGYRRIYGLLRREGIILSEKVIRRIMFEEGLQVPVKSHKKYSSYQGEITPSVENLLNRDFHADAPNKKWLTDITELSISAGKVYLSALVDCFDGMIVAWRLGTSPNANLVNSMLADGIRQLGPGEHPIVHTDRGCHYRWPGWIKCMEKALLTRSMSKKGCSPDNAACEGFWGRLKNEMFYPGCWTEISIEEFMDEVDGYIQWYNQERIKESLGYLSPMEYRQKLGLIA